MTTTSLSSKLTISSRSNDCPICGDTTGKCRPTEHYVDYEYSPGFIVGWVQACLCMTVDAAKNEIVGDYVCTGETSDGLWRRFLCLTPELQKARESWKGGNGYQISDEEIARREERHRQREEQKRQEQTERQARALSAEERHRWYSQILAELPINQDLINDWDVREFSPEEREKCGFKSVVYGQGLATPVDPRLPGASVDGTSLSISGDGYLCPIPDPEGRIVGCQIRLTDPGDGGRYRYLSTSRQTLQLHPPGENPIGYFRPKGKPKAIALAEGVGAKAFLVSQRYDAIVIGAPGGLWLASPNMFKSYLSRALAEVDGDAKLVIFPDAGDTANKQVINRWKKIAEFLANERWDFSFGWWGHVDKDYGDADELSEQERANISYISGSEFFTIAELGVKNAQSKKEAEEKILEREREFERLSAIRDKLTRITETPYKIVEAPTLEGILPALIEPGTANAVNSATATGKTRGSKPIINEADACSAWHNRLALAEANANEMGLTFKDAKAAKKHNFSREKKIAGCSPSMASYDPRHLSARGIVFIDEVDQVLDFNFSNICNRDNIRPLILGALEAQIESALSGDGNLLAMSADLCQKELDYLRALTPDGVPFRYIANKYRPQRGTIYLDTGDSPEGLVDELIQKIRAGERCFVLDDLKNGVRGCKSVSEYIRKYAPEVADLVMEAVETEETNSENNLETVLEIHADSSDDPRVKAFRINANEESKNYQCIVCSPSIVSGISITNQLFVNDVFVFAQGILTDRAVKQFINRIRGAKDIYMWVAEEGFPHPAISQDLYGTEEIKQYFRRNYDNNTKNLLSFRADYKPLQDEWYSPHFDLYCKNLSYHNSTMKFLKRFTKEHLEEEGYTIVETDFIPNGGTQRVEDELRNIWGRIELDEALAIASARFLSETEMEVLKHAEFIPPELLPAYKKTRLRDTFGEDLIEATTFEHKGTNQQLKGYAAIVFKNHHNEYARQLDNFYLLSQDITESVARDYLAEAKQLQYGDRFPGDIKWNGRKRRCREWLGLKEFLKLDEWWEPKNFKHVAEKAKSRSPDVKDVFNFTVDKIHDNQVFDGLIRGLGLKLKTKAVKGEKWKLRSIDEESWNYAQMYVEYKLSQKESVPQEELAPVPTVDEVADFAALVTEVEDLETYEAVISGIDPVKVEQALQIVPQEVRDRIAGFYRKPEPVQISLLETAPITPTSAFTSTPTSTPKLVADIEVQHATVAGLQSVSEEFGEIATPLTPLTIQQDEIIQKVDFEIQNRNPLFTPREDVTTWTKRLNRSLLMGQEIAKQIYHFIPQHILDAVWRSLTGGVQNSYIEIFASG